MPTRPVQKRRRPAHSCIECRRRKVRCDRNKPCGQCVAHKVPSCAYTDNRRIGSDRATAVTPGSGQQEDAAPLPGDRPGPISGTQSKTRVFGHGHWMNTMTLVRETISVYLEIVLGLMIDPRRPPNSRLLGTRICLPSGQPMARETQYHN